MNLNAITNSILSGIVFSAALSGCGGDGDLKSSIKDKGDQSPVVVPDLVASLKPSIVVKEPVDNKKQVYAEVPVELSEAAPENITISYQVEDVSATSSGQFNHYIAPEEPKVTILKDKRSGKILIPIVQNNVHEEDVNFTVSITSVMNSAGEVAATFNEGDEGKASVVIANSSELPTLTPKSELKTIVEGGEESITFDLDIRSRKAVTFNVQATGSVSSSDYSLNDGDPSITIAPLSNSVSVPIKVINDHLPEGGETLKLTMSNVVNAVIEQRNKSVSIFVPGSWGLNDTGANQYFDGVAFSQSPVDAYPHQDADYGLDAQDDNTLAHAGFNWIKLDVNGNTLPPTSAQFSCVKDVNTGLFIEVKTAKAADDEVPGLAFRAGGYQYTWYNSDNDLNGGSKGAIGSKLFANEAATFLAGDNCKFNMPDSNGQSKPTHCNTDSYLKEMNSRAICGVNDWRLPNPSEVRSIFKYTSSTDLGAIEYFSNFNHAQTFKAMTSATSVNNSGSAWCLNFDDGKMELCHKGLRNNIIAVRKSGD